MAKWFFVATVLLLPTALEAQTGQMPLGVGTTTCKAFNDAVARGDQTATTKFLEWAMGYVTGRSDQGAGLDGESPEPFSDAKSLYDDLVPQCDGNEDDLFIDAVREVAANVFGR